MTNYLFFGDHKAATMDFLANSTLVTAGLGAPNPVLNGCPAARIKNRRPLTEDMPGPWITALKRGGPGTYDTPVEARYRLDVWCFGSTELNAANLDQLVYMALCPDYPHVRGFNRKGCNVIDIREEGGPHEVYDPIKQWPVVIRTYMLTLHASQLAVA